MEGTAPRSKDWSVALLLSVFLGPLGMDRFYLGKIGTGILKLITGGGWGIWWLIDIILIATDKTTDARGLPLERRGRLAPRIRGAWLIPIYASPVLLVALFVATLFVGVAMFMKSSDAYKFATGYVLTNETVVTEIGPVKGFGFMPTGSFSTSGPSGEADFRIDVKGEKDTGVLYVKMTKRLGKWEITAAEFETSSDKRLNLVTSASRIPDNEELRRLVTETLVEFDRAVRTKDFTSFYAGISEVWKREITPKQIENAFQVFVERGISIGAVRDVPPVFDKPPVIDENGLLVLSGHVPTGTMLVKFTMRFTYEHPEWKLVGIHININ